MKFTLAEITITDLDSKLKQSDISSLFGKIKSPVVPDVSITITNFCDLKLTIICVQDIVRSQSKKENFKHDKSQNPERKEPVKTAKMASAFFGKASEAKNVNVNKIPENKSLESVSKNSASKHTVQSKKKNPLAAAFAIQSKIPQKSKVVISNVDEKKDISEENDIIETEETRKEKARKQEELKNIFNDDDAVMSKLKGIIYFKTLLTFVTIVDVADDDDVHMSDVDESEPIDEPIELDELPVENTKELKPETLNESNVSSEKNVYEQNISADQQSADKSKKRKHKKVLKKVTKMDAEGYLGMLKSLKSLFFLLLY